MYLPRSLIAQLYLQLQRTHHALSPPVLLLVALEPDALCACRILTALLKRDYIPHKIHPVAGYGDLARAGQDLVMPMRLAEGGNGGVVACLGVGGLVDLESVLGLEVDEEGNGGTDGVEVWVFDARRPWNLSNVFGAPAERLHDIEPNHLSTSRPRGLDQGRISKAYRSSAGGIVVFDDGDIEAELDSERDAWHALEDMPDLEEEESDGIASDADSEAATPPQYGSPSQKRKSWSDREDENEESEKENERPRQRRRSNSSSPTPSSPPEKGNRRIHEILQSTPPSNQQSSRPQPASPRPADPSARQLRRRLNRLRRKHEATLRSYHSLGTSYSEPICSLMYSLASELGREDNDLLWLAIVGVSSTELYGRTPTGISLTNHDEPTIFTGWAGSRGSRIRQMLRDEVRRLNPPELTETGREVTRGLATDVIPTHARSPTDNSIRLSPEPRFLLLRHWSLYDSMLHSPYLSAKLHIWSEPGRRRLNKLLAKMGVSLMQCKQNYTHMDMDLKRDLRQKLLRCAPMYGLEGLVPPPSTGRGGDTEGWGFVRSWGWKACLSAADVSAVVGAMLEVGSSRDTTADINKAQDPQECILDTQAAEALERFYSAYDALLAPTLLVQSIQLAQQLHRAILRTGTSLLQKNQLKHLSAFRLALVKEGPDVALFTNPGALTKLALWVGGAVAEREKDSDESGKRRRGLTPLVLGCLDEGRGVYIVVGLGGGSSGIDSVARQAERKEKKEKRDAKQEEKERRRETRRREREEAGDDEAESEEDQDSESNGSGDDSADEDEEDAQSRKGVGRNRFGNAFQEVIEETNARVRLDSFEHCIVEVKKEDLSGFLESLSMKAPVG